MVDISVVMTVYNGERFLRESLDSILAQDYDNYEVICVDDASTDKTSSILKQYGSKIKVITNHNNITAGGARNRGLAESNGEYVIFLDADDIYEKDMLRQAYVKAVEEKADVVIFREDKFDYLANKNIDIHYPEKYIEDLEIQGCFSARDISLFFFQLWNGWAWNKLFRHDFIKECAVHFQRMKSSNDGYFTHAVMAKASRMSFLNRVLIHHRIGDQNSISNSRGNSWYCCFLYLYQLKNFLETEQLYAIYEQSFVNWVCFFLEWNYRTLDDEVFDVFCKELKHFMVNHIQVTKYDKIFFYDEMYNEFIDRILHDNLYDDRFFGRNVRLFYKCNSDKVDNLILHLESFKGGIAVWGHGKYDIGLYDILKKSVRDIRIIDEESEKCSIECVLVATGVNMRRAMENYRGMGGLIVDVYSYLTLPLNFEQVLIR